MKRLLFLNVFLLAALYSCKKDGIAHGGEFGKSYLQWQVFKSACNNSYSYEVVTSSWVGYGTETTITVKQGKVTERSFIAKQYPGNGAPIIVAKEWKEDESQIATHMEGAAPLTLDEVYTRAESDWLSKRDNVKTYFEAANDGMISLCGYVPDGCADDCFTGITIKFIRALYTQAF